MNRKESGIIRKPVIRKAIKLPLNVRAYYRREQILNETMDEDVWLIVLKYEEMFRKSTASTHYLAVPRKRETYQQSKSYQKFCEVYYICRLKEWDAMFYIEVQFERCRKLEGKFKAPMINMLASDGAIKYAMKAIGSINLRYEKDMGTPARLKKDTANVNYVERLEVEILRSVLELQKALKLTKQGDNPQTKALELYAKWKQYSPEYLYSIPWLVEMIRDLPIDKAVEHAILTFDSLDADFYLKAHCLYACEEIENYYNIPINVNF